MENETIITVTQFTLFYDGLYAVSFEYQGIDLRRLIYLTPAMLCAILLQEGYTSKTDIEALDFYRGVQIKNTSLQFNAFKEEDGSISFLTSQEAEHYQDEGIFD